MLRLLFRFPPFGFRVFALPECSFVDSTPKGASSVPCVRPTELTVSRVSETAFRQLHPKARLPCSEQGSAYFLRFFALPESSFVDSTPKGVLTVKLCGFRLLGLRVFRVASTAFRRFLSPKGGGTRFECSVGFYVFCVTSLPFPITNPEGRERRYIRNAALAPSRRHFP
ncbi:hypothetical protein DRQ36_01300 [bacterium]|nr:MAG: hypothetical protein DRQ36_01300 [bacterium]